MSKQLFLWRAWNDGRERICDCGIANADTHDEAVAIARMCLGGPHRYSVTMFEVEIAGAGSLTRLRFNADGSSRGGEHV